MSDYTPDPQSQVHPMVRYVIADEDGEIRVRNTCPADVLPSISGAIECEPGVFNSLHYVAEGAVVPYTETQAADKATPHEAWFKWSNASMSWVDQRTLDDRKAMKLTQMKNARDAEQYGGFTWDSSTFDSNERSQSVLLGMFTTAMANALPDVPYRLQDNSWRTITAADMPGIWAALQALVAGAFAQFAVLDADIAAATTAEEVDAIVWS
jgi:hypothetical protein